MRTTTKSPVYDNVYSTDFGSDVKIIKNQTIYSREHRFFAATMPRNRDNAEFFFADPDGNSFILTPQ